MAVMDFLRFPPFPLLLLYGCGHYVALRKWITRECLGSLLLCCMFLCLQNQTRYTEVFNCRICFRDFMWGHGVSKLSQAGEVLHLLPMFPHLLWIIEGDSWVPLTTSGCGWVRTPLKAPGHHHCLPLNMACGHRRPQSQGSGVTDGCTQHVTTILVMHPHQCQLWCAVVRRQRRGWHLLQVYATVSVTVLLSGGATCTLCPSLCRNSPWQELLFKWRREKSEWERKCFRNGCFFIPAPKAF